MSVVSLEQMKERIKNHPQKMNVLYQWVKDEICTLKQFCSLIEFIRELELHEREIDSNW